MTAELQALRVQVTNVDARVASMDTRITDMDTRVADMDTRMSSIQDRMDATDAVYNQLPSTPKYSTPIVSQSIARHVVISPMDEDDDPGVSPSSLGKRPRTSPPGDESRRDDLSEEGAPGSPDKKRIRLEYPEGFVGRTLDFEAERLRRPSAEPRASDGGLSAPFPVYTGPSVGNVGAAPGPSSQRLTTASAGELENQLPISHNYDFSFTSAAWDPVASTPYVARFPRPEAPTSPSPVMPPSSSSYGHVIERHGRRERHDYFHPMGTPGRPRLRASDAGTSAMASGFVNPASLMRSPSPPPERRTTSNDVGASLGLVRPTNPDTPAPPVRRTMYGTELDNDSRFGDFGVEGVAAGFWNPAKYNPTSEDFE
ncbi:hypothetical protein OE88DRAFT_1650735 [Heliocybe sulcata]|uniref:Uncharacterized protein n=1 Tax=Heliocybe sulcata TaxID=5364 RepID=A0A5C3NJR4_9AGAM|nr:hypothetical protein OE88DRAFT_1650735 [Heliocybe sulcata]